MRRTLKIGIVLIALFTTFNTKSFAQQILGWDFAELKGQEKTIAAKINNENLNTSTLTKGAGIRNVGMVLRTFGGSFSKGFSKQQALAGNEYLEFTVNAKSGFQVSLTALKVKLRRNGGGPVNYSWMYSTDGKNFTDVPASETSFTDETPAGTAQPLLKLDAIKELQAVPSSKTIIFRLYAWAAVAELGSFAIGKSTTVYEEGKTVLFVAGKVEPATIKK